MTPGIGRGAGWRLDKQSAHDPTPDQGLGITQQWPTTRWKASVYVEGIGWLEAWGTSLPTALAALQTLATQRVAEPAEREEDPDAAS